MQMSCLEAEACYFGPPPLHSLQSNDAPAFYMTNLNLLFKCHSRPILPTHRAFQSWEHFRHGVVKGQAMLCRDWLIHFLALNALAIIKWHAGAIYWGNQKELLPCDILIETRNHNSHEKQSINQSNIFIKSFLHQLMSQSDVQKPSLKPQTASNAGVEARWLGRTL